MTTVGDPLVGRLLDGRYQITERLARGGMATVYRAVDTRLTRTVAVKVMHVGLGDDAEFARKFDREARAAARLAHPNVVAVFDQGSDLIEGHSSRPYIVMEHVDGYTLRDVINREAPMLPLRALEVIEPVLAALAAAHDAGLVHRDVKPENVLISDRGQIKVADFGLAKAISSQTSTATQGLLIGTVSYLPPELVVSGQADARSDVYSTGVVLFELLTGRKPHTGDTPIQVAYAHVHADVPAPSRFPTAGPVPPYLDALVARATSRDTERPAGGRPGAAHRGPAGAVRPARRPAGRPRAAARPADPRPRPTAVPPGRRTRPTTRPPSWCPPRCPARPPCSRRHPPAPLPRPPVRPLPAPRDDDRIARQRDRQVRRRRRGLVALLLVLLLTTGVAVAGWYLTTGRFTSTPALASLTQVQAERVADQAGLDVEFTEDFSESVPRGAVIETDPSAGSKILKGGRMTATVSRGPERFAMPTVVGLSREAAETAVQRANLSLDKVSEKYSDTVRDGHRDQRVEEARRPAQARRADRPGGLQGARAHPGQELSSARSSSGGGGACARPASPWSPSGSTPTRWPRVWCWRRTRSPGKGERGDTVTLTESLGPVMVPGAERLADGRQGRGEGDGRRRLQDPGPAGRGQLPRARLRRLQRPARPARGAEGLDHHAVRRRKRRLTGAAWQRCALLAMTAIWGSTFFLIKDIVTRIEVADLLAVRFALASLGAGGAGRPAPHAEPTAAGARRRSRSALRRRAGAADVRADLDGGQRVGLPHRALRGGHAAARRGDPATTDPGHQAGPPSSWPPSGWRCCR